MKARLIYNEGEMHATLFERLASGDYCDFRFAVAYARRSGVGLIKEALSRFFAKDDAMAQGIIGVNQGVTSRQAIDALKHTLKDNLYLRYSRSGSLIFHPKIYIMGKNAGAFTPATVIVGSSNLTIGGLQGNEECNVLVEIDESDIDFSREIEKFWQGIRQNEHTFGIRRADENILDLLHKHGALADEDVRGIESKGVKGRSLSGRSLDEALEELDIGKVIDDARIPRYRYFAMPLSGFDVSQKSSDPVILIPLPARQADEKFWFWPDSFMRERKHEDIYLCVTTSVDNKQHKERIRIYDYPRKGEFRLQSKTIKHTSRAREGDIILIERDGGSMHISLVRQTDRERYNQLYGKMPTPKRGRKRFGYFDTL